MSRTFVFLAGLALGLAAGFGIALLVRLAQPEPEPSRPTVPAPVSPPPATERRAGEPSRRIAPDPFASIDAGEIPAPPAGSGRLSGHVLDRHGRGLPGGVVRVTPQDGPPAIPETSTTDPDEHLRRDLRDVLRRHRWDRALGREAVTDGQGAFVLEGIDDRAWNIDASLAGWNIFRADQRDGNAVSAGDAVEFVAVRTFHVEVEIVHPDGRVPASGSVTVDYGDGNRGTSPWRPNESPVDLQAGRWRMWATAGDDEEFESAPVVVEIGDAAPPPVRLVLTEVPGFFVTLGAAGPLGPSSVCIRLDPGSDVADPATADPSPRRRVSSDWREEWVSPGERRAYLDLAPGRWTLSLRTGAGVEFHRETFVAGTALLRRDVAFPESDLRDFFLVRVLDPSGAAVDDVEFESGWWDDEGNSADAVHAVRLEDGRWRVPERSPAADWGGDSRTRQHWIRARSGVWGVAGGVVDRAPGEEMVLRFQTRARLVVKVDGAPADGPHLWVSAGNADESGGGGHLGDFYASAQVLSGVARLDALPARAAHVQFWATSSGPNDNRTPLAASRIDLVPGDNTLTFVAPPFQSLHVVFPEGTDPGRVVLLRVDLDGTSWPVSRGPHPNSPIWRDLAPGQYRLLHVPDGDMTLTLPGPAEVRFVARPLTAALLTIYANSPAHAAGLRNGDLAVALDGVEFESPKHIDALFAAAKLKPQSRLAVVRNRQRMEFEVDVTKAALTWGYSGR